MPFDSNGTFNRVIPGGWKADAAANIKIRADRHDDEDDGFATGLSSCITKDGRTQPVANIPMNAKRIINLGDPTADTDAATKKYVDSYKSFTTGSVITGADANGLVTFSSPTGSNGLSWVGADLSWLARIGVAGVSYNRLVLNDKADGSGGDVVSVNEVGLIQAADINVNIGTVGGVSFPGGSVMNTAGAVSVGSLSTGGRVAGGEILSTSVVYAGNGSGIFYANGDITGAVWNNWAAGGAYTAIGARIENRCTAFTNACVQSTRMAGEVAWAALTTGTGSKNQSSGYVCTGSQSGGGGITLFWRQPQVFYPNNGWLAAFAF